MDFIFIALRFKVQYASFSSLFPVSKDLFAAEIEQTDKLIKRAKAKALKDNFTENLTTNGKGESK